MYITPSIHTIKSWLYLKYIERTNVLCVKIIDFQGPSNNIISGS